MTRHAASLALVSLASLLIASCYQPRTPLDDLNQGPTRFMIKSVTSGGHPRQYALFVPQSFATNPSRPLPVIVYLHNIAEGGTDPRTIFRTGLAPFVEDRLAGFPYIVIFPQSSKGQWNADSPDAVAAIDTLDEVARHYPVDPDRVFLTGIGSGGAGAWAISAKHADRFAAVIPMASTGSNLEDAEKLRRMPVRAYHGTHDPFSRMSNDEAMVQRIAAAGGSAELIKTDTGHDCWDDVYGDDDFWAWIQNQHRIPAR